MGHIGNIAARSVQSIGSEKPPAKSDEQTPRVINAIWLRMTEIYGHKWVTSYGESDRDGTWAKGMAGLSGDELKSGFFACLNSGESWPPSLPQFRAMCRPPKDRRENAAAYIVPQSRWLEQKITDEQRAKGRQHVAEAIALAKRGGA